MNMKDEEMKEQIENIIGIKIDNNEKTEKEQIEDILQIELEDK